jgi:maltodextrin utilization protein YvdJ
LWDVRELMKNVVNNQMSEFLRAHPLDNAENAYNSNSSIVMGFIALVISLIFFLLMSGVQQHATEYMYQTAKYYTYDKYKIERVVKKMLDSKNPSVIINLTDRQMLKKVLRELQNMIGKTKNAKARDKYYKMIKLINKQLGGELTSDPTPRIY